MKKLKVCVGICMIIFICCNRISPDKKTENLPSSDTDRISLINAYVKGVNSILSKTHLDQSLIYTLGDYSFYVSRYSKNGDVVLLVEHGDNGEYGTVEKRYYMVSKKPVMYQEKQKESFPTSVFYARKTYFKGNEPFRDFFKEAFSEEQLASQPFRISNKIPVPFLDDVKKLNNAVDQDGKFDLVFNGITENPNSKFLILGKQEVNSYRAPILIKKDDELTKALTLNPEKYRGRKLDIKWKLKNNDSAVYVSGKLD